MTIEEPERHRFQPASWDDRPKCKVCGQKRTDSMWPDVLYSKVHEFDQRDVVAPFAELEDAMRMEADDD